MKLYELTQNYNNLRDLLDDPTVPAEMVTTALTELKGDIAEKCQNGIGLMLSMKADIDTFKAQEKRFKEMRQVLENRLKAVEDYYTSQLTAMELTKVTTQYGNISIRKNGGKAPLSIMADMVPAEYQKQTVIIEPDKEKIRTALEAGEKIPGCEIKERGTHLAY